MKLVCTLLFIYLSVQAAAQDMILRTDGRAIPCRILMVDTNVIVYREGGRGENLHISRNEVQRYIQRSAPMRMRDTVPINAARDVLYFTAQFGRGFPKADFGTQDLNSIRAGLALPGNMFGFMITYKPDPWVGIGITYRYQEFQFNESLFIAELQRQNPSFGFMSEIQPWKVSGLYAKVLFSIPLESTRKWTLDLTGMGGMPYYVYPSMYIVASLNGASTTLRESADRVRAPSFIGGGRVCFRPGPNMLFHLQADYLMGKATFEPEFVSAMFNQTYVYSQSFRALTVGIGITVIVQK